jgi:predicted metalloprotease
MRWQGRRESGNVEDRRGMAGPVAIGGGILGIIALLFNLFLGGDVDVSQLQAPGGGSAPMSAEAKAREDELAGFVKVVLAETEDVWNKVFAENGSQYREPTLVLFSGAVQSACGSASAASGPFYCPGDQKLYIDLSFYDELSQRFGAPGDFAMAYVVSHEVGHHIQTLLGTTQKLAQIRQQVSQEEYNKYSVMLELQADFLAGVWAHHTANKNLLDANDIEEAMRAANAIGDDRLQKQAQGYTVPESFTHGTSEQRMYWFKRGYESGDLRQGDTFNDVKGER